MPSASTLRTLAYTSTQTSGYNRSLYTPLLLAANAFNAQLAVTGVLLVAHKRFCQVLEGPPEAIDQVMERIRLSSLHENLLVHTDGVVARRMFPNWAMGGASETSPARWKALFERKLQSDRGLYTELQHSILQLMIQFCATEAPTGYSP